MKRHLIFSLFSLAGIAFGCSQDYQEEVFILKEPLATRSAVVSESISEATLSSYNPALMTRLRQHFGDKQFSIQRVSKDNSPLLEVLNFEGGGWAIVDGVEDDADQILAYGRDGNFDAERISSPEVAFWFRMIQNQLSNDKATSSKSNAKDEGEQPRSFQIDYNLDYYWVRLPIEPLFSQDTSGVDHLLETKWGQGEPWNYQCPIDSIVNPINHITCPTGCVSVAISQILYYLHFNIGWPVALYHTLVPNYYYSYHYIGGRQYRYYFFNNLQRLDAVSPSPRWNAMALDKGDGTQTSATEYVGDLMIDVGQVTDMKYHYWGSGTVALPEHFSYFGINCYQGLYAFDTVKEQLLDEQPVLISGSDGTAGHAWVIDGYRQEIDTTQNRYQWFLIPPDSLSYYPGINYEYVLTEQQKQSRYPNLQEFDIEYENPVVARRNYLRMNWGSDGDYDQGNYMLYPNYSNNTPAWSNGNDVLPFAYNLKIIYDFQEL